MLILLFSLFFGHPVGSAAPLSDAVRIHEIKQGPDRILVAENTDRWGPRHLSVDLPARQNIQVSQGLPLQVFLKPGEKKEILRISPLVPNQGYSYSMQAQEGFGDPAAVHDDRVVYLLPWEHGKKFPLGQGYFGAYTHQGIRALDFDMPSGTKICAAREGVVVALKQDSNRGGPSAAFAFDANNIDILHADGTWATYAHLEKNGALVRLGQHVAAGQVIGLSGATGQASGPHLHFSVMKAGYGPEPETLATRFWIAQGQAAPVEEGKYYYSWHPGSPAFARVDADKLDEAALALKTKPAHSGKLNFRTQRLDNRDLIYCVNGTSKSQEVTFEMASNGDVRASQGLPFTRVVPAHTELFLLSVSLNAGQASYQSRFSFRPIP